MLAAMDVQIRPSSIPALASSHPLSSKLSSPSSSLRTRNERSEQLFHRIQQEANVALQVQEDEDDDDDDEGLFSDMLHDTILSPEIQTFEEMVASVVSYRLTNTMNADDDRRRDHSHLESVP